MTEVQLLGPVQVVRDGSSAALGGPRQRALLALLAVQPGRIVDGAQLIEELWAGEPPEGAETTLRSYVSRLRVTLGGAAPIRAGDGGYALDLAAECIDAVRFERLIREAEAKIAARSVRRAAALVRDALGLWRGQPFGDVGLEGTLAAEAARLEQLRLHALELRIGTDLDLGAAAELVDELEGLVRLHPYREVFWRQLMLALYRAERQADALAAFHRARVALDEQLGIEPGEELQALETAILRHEVPRAAAAELRHNLPASISSFVGRADELRQVAGLLAGNRLVTLTGVGGVGKTRLAIEAARLAIDDHPDGVFLVDLAPVADPALVTSTVAAVLEVQEQPGHSFVEALAAHLEPRDVLLVLDNCEHLVDGVANLAGELLARCPRLRVLATSRDTIGAPGEVDVMVAPMRLPADGDPGSILRSEAVQLFLERAREARPGLPEDESSLAAAAQICRDLDGLPLAMELAAARAKALSLPEIGRHLSDRFRFLVSWRRINPARHRTLREAMDWSYQLLSPAERDLLARLSVFAGGLTLDAAEAVAARDGERPTVDVLQRLVEASLVIADPTSDRTRYRLLETVRQYAAEQLGEGRAAAEAALTSWVVGLIQSVFPDGSSPIPATAYERLDADLDNIRAALRIAARDPDPWNELTLGSSMWKYWWIRGYLAEGRAVYDGALERRGLVRTTAGIRTVRAAASLAWSMGDIERATQLGAQALDAAVEEGEVHEQLSTLNLLGVVANTAGDYAAAERYCRDAIDLAETVDNLELVTMYRNNLGSVFLNTNRYDEARATFTAVLEYRRPEGRSSGVALAYLNLGQTELQAGNLAAAEEHFKMAVDAFDAVGFKGRLSNALQGLAAVEARSGRAEMAARRLGAAAAVVGGTGWAVKDSPMENAAAEAALAELGVATFQRLFEEGLHHPPLEGGKPGTSKA